MMANIKDLWPMYVKSVYGHSTSPDNPPFGNHAMSNRGYECLQCGKRIIPMDNKGMGHASGRMRSHIEAHYRRGEIPVR